MLPVLWLTGLRPGGSKWFGTKYDDTPDEKRAKNRYDFEV